MLTAGMCLVLGTFYQMFSIEQQSDHFKSYYWLSLKLIA